MQIASLFASIGAETTGLEKGLKGAESSIQQTAKTIKKLGDDSDNSLKGMAQGSVEFGQNWMKTMGAVGTAAAPAIATVLAMKKVLDFSHEGAQLQRLEDTSFSLARSMGMDMGHIMDSVRTASLGMVSDYDIMQASSRAMMLGVGNSAEQLGQLMEVAAARGRAMGISTTQAFNDIVTGVGRMSPLILDNLGIVTGGQKTFDAYAESLGKTAEALTDAEKKQALINKAIEGTAGLLAQTGGLTRDTAGNWEYAAAQIKTYTDNLKEAIALSRGGDKGFDYANGLPVGKEGGLGYIEAIGLAFERANIDSHNKELLDLAASIGLVSEADKKWIDMPVISTREGRAEWVQRLNPALKEYSRLVNEAGVSSKDAAEKVTYLYETFGSAAFIDNTNEWVAANDRVWQSTEEIVRSMVNMEGAALANQQRLNAWKTSLYEAADALRNDLTIAYQQVTIAEQGWREGVSGDLAGRLAEDYENNKISLDKYKESLGTLDKVFGTNQLAALEFSLGLDELYQQLKEDPEGFEAAAKAFEAMFMPLDQSVQDSMALVSSLQGQLTALEKTYNAKVNIVIATYGTGVGGNLGDLGGDLGDLGGNEGGGGGEVPQFGHAMGGYELSGQPYLVGEAGPELFIPDTNGRVYSNPSSGSMLGGGNGDLLAALGRLPTASDIALAVRDALLMVGA